MLAVSAVAPEGVDPDRSPAITVLSEDECWRLLRHQSLGRIAFLIEGEPEVLPVNYAELEREIVFRTGVSVIREYAPRSPACFEVDSFADVTASGWSVVAHGRVREVPEAELPAVGVHPAAPGAKPHLMALAVERISGRRFSGPPLTAPMVADHR